MIYVRNLKQALIHGLVLKKIHRAIKSNQKAWLKSYIDMNAEMSKNATNDFEKDFFKLKNNAVFRKTMGKYGTKLSCNKNLFKKLISNRNAKNTDTHE